MRDDILSAKCMTSSLLYVMPSVFPPKFVSYTCLDRMTSINTAVQNAKRASPPQPKNPQTPSPFQWICKQFPGPECSISLFTLRPRITLKMVFDGVRCRGEEVVKRGGEAAVSTKWETTCNINETGALPIRRHPFNIQRLLQLGPWAPKLPNLHHSPSPPEIFGPPPPLVPFEPAPFSPMST
jgi:hypothetical protein